MEKLKVSKWSDGNREEVNGVILSRGDHHLDISFQGNQDLYFTLYGKKDSDDTFVIGKDNYEVYQMFDNLYYSVMGGIIFDEDRRNRAKETGLIHGKKITWKRDDYREDVDPFFEIEKRENAYLLKFGKPTPERELELDEYMWLDQYDSHTVRLRTSGSRYDYFYIPFMELYRNLRGIDTHSHQIHMEEYLIDKQIENGKPLKKILYSKKKSA